MINDFSVDMNEYLPLRDVVFNTLRKAILKGELKPGERLMEIALAERLGVSRTPVREAMRKLNSWRNCGKRPKTSKQLWQRVIWSSLQRPMWHFTK